MGRQLIFRVLSFMLLTAASTEGEVITATATSRVLDLAAVPASSQLLQRIHGASGRGKTGVPVAGGPDCDGDGFPDTAVSFLTAEPPLPGDRLGAGEIYLVFGDGALGEPIDTAVASPTVLRIAGAQRQEAAGSELWMDDVTGDGLGDLLIARQNFSAGGARIGAGALSIVAGSPNLRSEAEKLGFVDLGAPPATLHITTLIGARPLDRFGIWVRTGDVTGDGIADIVVGADQEDGPGEENRGAVYVIQGGGHLANGGEIDLAAFGSTSLAGRLAKLVPPPGSSGFHLGATCQIADLDGNGRGEVLAAATIFRAGAVLEAAGAPPGSAEAVGGTAHGTVFIAWDDNFPPGLWPAGATLSLAAAPGSLTRMDGGSENLHFGEEILGGADFDGDGEADLFVGDLAGDGSPAGDRGLSGIGHVIYRAADLRGQEILLDSPPAGFRQTRLLGPSPGAIAADTAALGDFDGDGHWDLAMASPLANPREREQAGMLHVLFGRSGRWPAEIDLANGSLPPPQEARITQVDGAQGARETSAGGAAVDAGDTLAYSAAAGDLNGDGLDDLIVNEMRGNGVAPEAVDVGNLLLLSGAFLAGHAVVPSVCLEDSRTLCLGAGRFEVRMDWETPTGTEGTGKAQGLTADTGYFWFFNPRNVEVVVKLLDGCRSSGRFWVFAAGLTNVATRLQVTDVLSGQVREYLNPLGTAFQPIQDTAAFHRCDL